MFSIKKNIYLSINWEIQRSSTRKQLEIGNDDKNIQLYTIMLWKTQLLYKNVENGSRESSPFIGTVIKL